MPNDTPSGGAEGRFQGILPPVTTPFDENGEVAWGSLERNLRRYIHTPVSGLLLLGSNGEAPHLDSEERLRIVRTAEEVIPRDRRLVVGVAFAAQRQALEFVEALEGLRIDALLASAPSYYKNRMGEAALGEYFTALAEASPFPLLLYNVPQYSGLALPAVLTARLAAHPNIIGMKDSSGDFRYLQKVLESTRNQEFQVLLGSAQIFGPALGLGIEAGILAVACPLPELPALLLEACRQGEDILPLQRELFTIAEALTSRYGVAGVKHAMDRVGFEGGFCRRPLLPLTDEEKNDIDRTLEASPLARRLMAEGREIETTR